MDLKKGQFFPEWEKTRKAQDLKTADFVIDNYSICFWNIPNFLKTCDFNDEKNNMVLIGDVGTGKDMETALRV